MFERFLAGRRALLADSLIAASARAGRILDIGCGATPLFLSEIEFAEKFGVDAVSSGIKEGGAIYVGRFNAVSGAPLPFEDNYFDVVTMLAVIEHFDKKHFSTVAGEVRRVLKPGGVFILTTPPAWADPLLRIMAFFWLVSPVEMAEHKGAYTVNEVVDGLVAAGFSRQNVQAGYFLLLLNSWARAQK